MRRRRFGVTRLPVKIWDTMTEAYLDGQSACALAKKLKVSKQATLYQLRKRSIEIRKAEDVRRDVVSSRWMGEAKWCPKCDKTKPPEDFGKDRSKSDGLHRLCKECIKERSAFYRANLTPEQIQARKETVARYSRSARGMENQKKSARKNYTSVSGRFNQCRSAQKRNGRSWTLTKEQFASLISNHCTYCGGPLPKTSAGLDRLDNTRGYDLDNVTPCCALCNYARRDQFTVDEMKQFIGPAIRAIRMARAQKEATSHG
jgi:hypothetical protein